MWITTKAVIMNGIRKCRAKNRFRVGFSTANPPQIHWTRSVPISGIAEKILVITVAAQNLIWPHGRTYPRKAVAIEQIKMITPIFQVSGMLVWEP